MDGIDILRAKLKALPVTPGVYRMLNEAGEVLYVGKAKNLKARLTSYTQPERMGVRIRKMVFETRTLTVVETRTEVEALLLEANLIKSLKPRYNIIFRDDASYVSVVITDEPTPKIQKHRGVKKAKGSYFGPYPSAGAVYATLDLMERAFRLRTCSDSVFKGRTRPCLKYDIKRCSGPCVGKIAAEDYLHTVRQAKRFLQGERQQVLAQLQQEMQAKAEALDYEGAAAVRDRIRALAAVSSASTALTHALDEADVFALVREGGKLAVQAFYYRHGQHVGNHLFTPKQLDETDDDAVAMQAFLAQHYSGRAVPLRVVVNVMPAEAETLGEALQHSAGRKVVLEAPQRGEKRMIVQQAARNAVQALRRKAEESADWQAQFAEFQAMLGLENPLERMECYDISNTQGRQAVASQVVAGPEGMLKNRYRKYAIKGKDTPDDYAMLAETLGRRLKKGDLPDVFLIDGGKGQLNVLVKVMEDAGLLGEGGPALCSIAKGEERDKGLEVVWHWRGNRAVELPVAFNSPLKFVLQRIRDEAHRFAITYHRQKRAKALVASPLDDIPGIGPAKKKALLLHFGSRAAVEGAALEELMRVPGISKTLAEAVWGWFHGGQG
ncbi:MAG: excinuclease ABC subunit UvrC [Pseudomonadaceae bacterium]|nr:excinuclease ABC subunit UvrC [Pseudomonadaceae bacterium]